LWFASALSFVGFVGCPNTTINAICFTIVKTNEALWLLFAKQKDF
jgi:hypothetical protein